MSIPTRTELGEIVYGVMREESGSIPFAPGLNALTEVIGATVRDAVLEGAAQEAERLGYYVELFSDNANLIEDFSLADWLRGRKAGAQ